MSLYKRDESEFWWCAFRVQGRLFRISTGKTDRRDASKEERRLRAEAEANSGLTPRATNGRTLQILAAADLQRAENDRTTERHQYVLRQRWLGTLERLGHETAPEEVTEAKLSAFIKRRESENVRGQTIRRELCDVRRALLIAVDRGWLAKLPKWPRLKDSTKDTALAGKLHSDEALRAVLSQVSQDVREACAFCYATGLRFTELQRVNIAWLARPSFEAEVPWILTLPPEATKTRHQRVVGISEEVAALMRRRAEEHGPHIFPRRSGYSKALGRASRAAGYSQTITLRDLRHMFASEALQRSGDIQAVSDALGHSALTTTALYLHSTQKRITGLAAASGAKAITLTRSQVATITPSVPQVSVNKEKLERETGFEPATFSLGSCENLIFPIEIEVFPVKKPQESPTESKPSDHTERTQVRFDHRSPTTQAIGRAVALADAATVLEGWVSAECSGCSRTVEVFANGSACVCPVCQNQINTEGAVYVG